MTQITLRRGALLSGTQCASCGQRLYRSQRARAVPGERTWIHPHCATASVPDAPELVHEAVRQVCARRDVDPVVACELVRLATEPAVRRACGDDLGSWARVMSQQYPPVVDVLADLAGPWYVDVA